MSSTLFPQEFSLTLDNGLEIAGLSWGDTGDPNKPKLLALHGWLDNAASFINVAPILAEHFVVKAIDFAGHGHSSHRPHGVRYHLIDNVDDVAHVVDALGWEQFYVLGHSMGGGVATYYAGSFPERLLGLVLIEGLGSFTSLESEAPQILRKAVNELSAKLDPKAPLYPNMAAAVELRTVAVGIISEAASALLCARGTMPVPGGITWRSDARLKTASAMRLTEPMVQAYISQISCPTLVLGGKQGFADKAPLLDARINCLQDGTKLQLPGNHHLHLEPDFFKRVGDEILAFLRGIDTV